MFKKVTGCAKKMNKELEKKVGQAVKLLQVCYKAAGEPLEVAYSGGKDSDVILELAKMNKDYGDAFHKSFEEFGVTAGVVRLNDKMERVKSLVKNGNAEVKDESLMDTLKDMASYAVMLYVELHRHLSHTISNY